ncbi:relaxase/mobilization nuclease domain-containing protein [Intestinibacillus sp. Marseille-P6563]|uniref:relaxase/mobilization nuclease domain-containing protein n=1 Tax=Intestinibacillus sp. Marseille-P6563 TaxID=2364792 RepID=UPI0013E08E3C
MATLKHLSSKNADYGAAEQYLTFEHDEFTGRPVLDENGRLVPRQDYRISSLNCGGEDFAVACMRANLRYGKNQRREDVKSHHYILSFDPRDGPDHGLTMDKAQALGERFCAEQFPGHQALVCTHPDGHNHSGNIHVHIVINSLRVAEAERKPYMDRASDTQAGAKHRCTAAAMRHFRAEVMELCQGAGLYQIDLLGGSKNRVTEREYWAQKKGQLALDTEAAAQGKPPTKFETDKEKLRREIRAVLAVAVSFEDFAQRLLQRGITVKESRGRLSYLTPDRTKPITARKLGDDFDRAAVGAALERNAARPSLGAKPSIREQLRQPQGVQRMVDIEAKKAEGTEEEKRLIDEKMKQLPIKQYGAYFRKMAIDGYILVVDRSDTKAYIRELQAVSRNINQIAKRANATGTVYRQDIEDIKKAVDEIWRLQRRTLCCYPMWASNPTRIQHITTRN